MELISLALAGRVVVNVSAETFDEVERTDDVEARQRRLARAFVGFLSIPLRGFEPRFPD
jgi:hypothetical protein